MVQGLSGCLKPLAGIYEVLDADMSLGCVVPAGFQCFRDGPESSMTSRSCAVVQYLMDVSHSHSFVCSKMSHISQIFLSRTDDIILRQRFVHEGSRSGAASPEFGLCPHLGFRV